MGRTNWTNRVSLAGEPVGSRGGLVVELSLLPADQSGCMDEAAVLTESEDT
jgi:hypothetical protein